MEPRGRGRGWGRARGAPSGQSQQQQPRPGQAPRPGGQQQPQQPRPGGARQPVPAGPRGSAPDAWARPQWKKPPPAVQTEPAPAVPMGRGGRSDESTGAIPRQVTSHGDNEGVTEGGSGVARGGGNNVRGRVVNRNEIFFTKPENLNRKQGTIGTPIRLRANYFPILQKGKWCLYQYRVDFNPDIDHTGFRKRYFRTAVQELLVGGYLFDGTMLFTPQRIHNDAAELFVKDDNDENVRINIRLVGDLAWGDSHYIQLFNIIIRKCLALMGLQLIGRNYFMPDAEVKVQERDAAVKLWPGYFTSMRQHEHDILLNVDLQFKFMRVETVYDMLLECRRGPHMLNEFRDLVIGNVVLTHYNNKTYRIDDVDPNSNPMSTFKKRDGSEISYRDYFKSKYGVTIRVPDQIMLVSRTKPREIRAGMPDTVYLVPELCQMTGLTEKQRSNMFLMKALANTTRMGADGRIKKLMEFSRKVHSKPEVVQEIRRWDLNIAEDLITIKGRVLPTEQIIINEKVKPPAGEQADWTHCLRQTKMFSSPAMNFMAVVCPEKVRGPTENFIRSVEDCARSFSWSVGRPKLFCTPDERTGSYLECIEDILNRSSPTLLLVILTSNSEDRYAAIKRKCLVDRGISSQMFVARNFTSKGIRSIVTKVTIQLNCKIGGAPWSVPIPLTNFMVVGYDVCRDTVNKKLSFSGLVASLDRQMTRFFNMAIQHELEEELSNSFSAFLVLACKKYKEQNGNFPDRILIYRDGVGIGQLRYVYEHEVINIKKRLKEEIYKDSELKLGVIVVNKRINTRIFYENNNPPPGTVVDDVITLPESYDFFLVSQCVRQGSVAPTYYNVIEDNLGLAPERLQILTYKMTHMYYNWSGTVRVPAPCQYAHKLAFMVSKYLHRSAHRDLQTVLYYL